MSFLLWCFCLGIFSLGVLSRYFFCYGIFGPGSIALNFNINRVLDNQIYLKSLSGLLNVDGQAAHSPIRLFASAHVEHVGTEPQPGGDYLVQFSVDGMVCIT